MATLKYIRESAGLTKGQAAKLLGLETFQLAFAEADDPDGLPDDLAQKMAGVYGVSVEFVRGGPPSPGDLIEHLIEHKGDIPLSALRDLLMGGTITIK